MIDAATLQVAGLVGMLGSTLYAAGDVLLLAPTAASRRDRRPFPIDVSGDRVLRRRVPLLEELARLPYWRLRWGALLGVIGAPVTVAGLWLFYEGVSPAGLWLALPPTLLFLAATIAGPFVHGSFGYVGDAVQTLYAVSDADRPLLLALLRRGIATLLMSYAPLLLAMIVASFWGSVAILSGSTRFPTWMAVINPVTMTLAWLLLKRGLPKRVGDFLQGAGFNIAYFAWIAAMTATIR
jgi:hypothetical protein